MKNKSNPSIQSMLEHLAQETIQPDETNIWPAVRANLAASQTLSKNKELSVNKRILIPAGMAVLFLAIVVVFMARNATPVSAQAILDKAYAAQSGATSPADGIQHIRSEMYTNIQALPADQAIDQIVESYHDLNTGKRRVVTLDAKTGKVVDVFGYDGTFTYSVDYPADSLRPTNPNPLTVYRTPQGKLADQGGVRRGDDLTSKDIFDKMRGQSDTHLDGQETWADGRKVYVLSTQQPIKVQVNGQIEQPIGKVIVYFDVETYKMLGNRVVMQKDGQDIIITSQTILADEFLPASASVAWDLSDLQGITLLDDPDREHGDLLPEAITPQELATRTTTAYLLNAIPDGYSLEISEPQRKKSSTEPYMYIASYRTEANDYFVIQSGLYKDFGDEGEAYTTASGLVLHFTREVSDPSGKQYVTMGVDAPNGVFFMVTSTLSKETVKAWAENLVLVK